MRHKPATKAASVALLLVAAEILVFYPPLRVLIGPEWYSGTWGLGEQLAYGQLVATFLALPLAGGLGWYAIAQFRLSWVSSERELAREAEEREVAKRRMLDGLRAIHQALVLNREALVGYQDNIREPGTIALELQLSASTWDAVKDSVTPYLDGVSSGSLAVHFDRIRSFEKVAQAFFDVMCGVPSALQGAPVLRKSLHSYLVVRSAVLLKQIDTLTGAVEKMIGGEMVTVTTNDITTPLSRTINGAASAAATSELSDTDTQQSETAFSSN